MLFGSAYFCIMSSKRNDVAKKGLQTSYISTLIGISLVLFMIGLVIGGLLGIQSFEKQAKESLQGDIFFKSTLNDADIKQLATEIKNWKMFNEVAFISPERAIQEFGGDEQKAEMDELLGGENPLPPTVAFRPKAEFATKKGMETIKNELLKKYADQIDEVSYNKASVESVNLGFRQFFLLFLTIAGLLVIVAVALINNTIRLSLYSKRFTIKTMQLVGATSGFIRKPFVIQAILQGAVAAFIGTSLLLTVFFALNNVMDTFEISYTLTSLLILIGSLLVIGIFITLVSTFFALNKYLRMKLDDLY